MDNPSNMIGERELKLMGPEHYLINAARGPIVDEKALVRALKEGWIKGAGLDVYEREPKTEPGLTDCWNAVLLPHLGSATITARAALAETAAKNPLPAGEGKTPPNIANPGAPARHGYVATPPPATHLHGTPSNPSIDKGS